MVNSNAQELLDELTRVNSRFEWFPIALVLAIATVGYVAWRFGPAWLLLAVVGVPVVAWVRHEDITRGTVVLDFDLDPIAKVNFEGLRATFAEFAACSGHWRHVTRQATQDWKHNAGAGAVISRFPLVATVASPPRTVANLDIPRLPAGRQSLYFMPNWLLIMEGGRVGAIAWGDLSVSVEEIRFIEQGTPPSDGSVVDTTWLFVNKGGGPDRRFKNNRQLPVMLYGAIHLTSASGLNEYVSCSRVQAAHRLASGIDQMRRAPEVAPQTEVPAT
jgi:hypothetical protein